MVQESRLHQVPTEIWALAWSHCALPELKALSLTCSRFHDICEKHIFEVLSFEPPAPPESCSIDNPTEKSAARYDALIKKVSQLATSNKRSFVREWYFKNAENPLVHRRRNQVPVNTTVDEKADAFTATFFAVLPLFRSLRKLHLYNVEIDQARIRTISRLPLDDVSFYRTRFTEPNNSVYITPRHAVISTPHFSNATFNVPSPKRLETLSILSRVPIPNTIPGLLSQNPFIHLRVFHILVVPSTEFYHLIHFLTEKCPNLEELGIEHVQKQDIMAVMNMPPAAIMLQNNHTHLGPNMNLNHLNNSPVMVDLTESFPSETVPKLRRFKGCIELAHAVSRGRKISAVQIRGFYQHTKIQDIADAIWKPLLESDVPLEDLRFANEIAMQEGVLENIQTGVLCFPSPEEESEEVGSIEVDEEGVPLSHFLTYRGMIERLAMKQQLLPSGMEELSLLYTNDETFYVKFDWPRRVLIGLSEHYPSLRKVVLGNVAGPYTWLKDAEGAWKRHVDDSWQFLKNLGNDELQPSPWN
ncbi:hypothetical protein BJ165DRAFT_1404647 [Panaeolus papilionaceus]|nr:hypothetical protein BJ165DRAFT_1404647 [Panaeolus papilionaceus]